MAERAYPEDKPYKEKSKYYYAFKDRYEFGKKYTNDKTVLDVPCGCGWGTSLINNSKNNYGIDISHEAINYAKIHFEGNFIQGSMCKLPYKENKFDVALCFEGIEHITKEEGLVFINELKRVVVPGGLIVGSVPILNKNGDNTGNPFHKYEYPEDYLKNILNTNFEIIKYLDKKGGDGPIVFFVVKNIKK